MPIQQILLGSGAIPPAAAPTNLDLSLATATTIAATYTNTTDWGNPTFGVAYSTTNDANTIKTSGTVLTGNSTTVTSGSLTAETTYYFLAWANSGYMKVWSSTIVSAATYPAGTTIAGAGSTQNAAATTTWSYYSVPTDKLISFYAIGGSGGSGGSWNHSGSRGGNGGSAAASYTFASGTYGSSVLLRGNRGAGGAYASAAPYNSGSHGAGAAAWMYKDTSNNWQEIIVAGGGGGGSSAWNNSPQNADSGGSVTSINSSEVTNSVIGNGGNGSNGSQSGGSYQPGENESHSNRNAYGTAGGYGGSGNGSTSRKTSATGGYSNSAYGNGGMTYTDENFGNGGGGGGGYKGGAGGAYPRGGSGGASFKMAGATPISQVLNATTGSYNGGGHGTAGTSGTTGVTRMIISS